MTPEPEAGLPAPATSSPPSAPRFPLGRCVVTPTALAVLKCHNLSLWDLLRRHQQGDWGDVCAEDAEANERALITGQRLLSIYTLPDEQRLYLLTEADRSLSSLLLPGEY